MVYEFKGIDVPPHKCNVLDTSRVSATRTNLICVVCKQVIGWWDNETQTNKLNKEYPEDSQYYTETLLESLK